MLFRSFDTLNQNITTVGKIGINTSSPGSTLDVKGTIRLSGSASGYVGLTPASSAGSTTYTLPSADGTNGQFLKTNGSGTLSWATAGGGYLGTTATQATSTNQALTGTTPPTHSERHLNGLGLMEQQHIP